jgi:dienelactone hydrolase
MTRVYLAAGVFILIAVLVWLALSKPWVMDVKVTDPGEGGQRINEAGVLGNYYPAGPEGLHPGILVFGGSEGGLDPQVDRDARALNRLGYSVLALSFYRGPGQSAVFDRIPLETFDRALDWLAGQQGVDRNRLAIVGMSKGAEAALLVASHRQDLSAVVAAVPSSVVWPGFDWARFRSLKSSSWSRAGRPAAALPYGRLRWQDGMSSIYTNGLKQLALHPDAIIPVERSRAAILLICGGRDQIWPSCPMSEQIKARSESHGGPRVVILAYPEGDHGSFGSPLEKGGKPRRFGLSKEAPGSAAARADSWPKVIAFLGQALGRT